MRFLLRGLTSLLLLAVTVGFVAIGVARIMQARDVEEARQPDGARERTFVVNVATLERVTAEPVITAYGEILSWRTLELRAATVGRLVELSDAFRDGAAVDRGELLFAIDPAATQAGLADAEVALLDARAEEEEAVEALAGAEEELAAAATQQALRGQALARQRQLQQRDIATAAAVEEAQLALAQADQTVANRSLALVSARNRVDRATRAIERAAIARDEAARGLGETRVTAEFAGLLSDVDAAIGRRMSANESLGTLIDLTALDVAFRVSNAQFARLLDDAGALRQAPVVAALDLGETTIEVGGGIERVGAVIAAGDTGRMVYARLDASRDTVLRPGDFVTVTIAEPPLPDVAIVPATATDGAGRLLVVNDESRLEEVETTILRRQGDMLIVASAPFGATYVTERTPQLGRGTRVRAAPAGPPGPAAATGRVIAAPAGASVAGGGDRIALDDDQRQGLIDFLQADQRIPEERKTRLLDLLAQPEVPRGLVERLQMRRAEDG